MALSAVSSLGGIGAKASEPGVLGGGKKGESRKVPGEISAKDRQKPGETGAKVPSPAGVTRWLSGRFQFDSLRYPFFYPFYTYSGELRFGRIRNSYARKGKRFFRDKSARTAELAVLAH